MRSINVELHEIAIDGLPEYHNPADIGRIAFLHDGSIYSGWPLAPDDNGDIYWELSSGFGGSQRFYGVTHWLHFPDRVWNLEK